MGTPEVAVVTVQPEKATLTTELPGRTSAFRVAEIRPQVNGLIQKRLFTEGSDVQAGQDLYQIDPAPFQAAYDNAAANLVATRKAADRARAALRASLAGVTRQHAVVQQFCPGWQRNPGRSGLAAALRFTTVGRIRSSTLDGDLAFSRWRLTRSIASMSTALM